MIRCDPLRDRDTVVYLAVNGELRDRPLMDVVPWVVFLIESEGVGFPGVASEFIWELSMHEKLRI